MADEQKQQWICLKCGAVDSFDAVKEPEGTGYVMCCMVCGFAAVKGTKIELSVEDGVIVAKVGLIKEEGVA